MNRSQSKPPRDAPDAGFTLLEVLVTLVLIALVTAGMPSLLRLGQRAMKVADEIQRPGKQDALIDFVEARLSETVPVFTHGESGLLAVTFLGTPRTLEFVAPLEARDAAGLYLFRFGATGDGGEEASDPIVLSWQAFQPSPSADVAAPPGAERIIAARARNFRLRYLGSPGDGASPAWTETWTARDRIPRVIEISFVDESAGNVRVLRRIELKLAPAN